MNTEIRFEPFDQVAAIIKAFAGFQDNLRQSLQQSMAQLQQGLEQVTSQFAAEMAAYDAEEAEVFTVLSRAEAGWGWSGTSPCRRLARHCRFTRLEARQR